MEIEKSYILQHYVLQLTIQIITLKYIYTTFWYSRFFGKGEYSYSKLFAFYFSSFLIPTRKHFQNIVVKFSPSGHNSVWSPWDNKDCAVNDGHFQSFHKVLLSLLIEHFFCNTPELCHVTQSRRSHGSSLQQKIYPCVTGNNGNCWTKKYLKIENWVV